MHPLLSTVLAAPPIIVQMESGTDWPSVLFGFAGSVLAGVFAGLGLLLAEKHHREARRAEEAVRVAQRAAEAETVVHTLVRSLVDAVEALPTLLGLDEEKSWTDLREFRDDEKSDRQLQAMDALGRDLLLESRHLRDPAVEAFVRSLASATRQLRRALELYFALGRRPERGVTAAAVMDLLGRFQSDCVDALRTLEDYLAMPQADAGPLREKVRHLNYTLNEAKSMYENRTERLN